MLLQSQNFRQIQPHTGKADNITKFSTCGIDGLVALWDLQVSACGLLLLHFSNYSNLNNFAHKVFISHEKVWDKNS